ncbi:Xylulose kinase [hydrothermal vent metagenome]|uniref:Xylulose kinase n=1 Tax=hydrothermal vent metagenome TaxID=652676 RepID=A0A3B1E0T1_9ZZZZ
MTLLLGIDIGTSATKAVVCDADGQLLAKADSPLVSLSPRPGWSEQEPDGWWAATIAAVQEVLAEAKVSSDDIAGVGLSGQMHGSVLLPEASLLDSGGGAGVRALRPALLWNDQRTAQQCERIEGAVGGRRELVELVGNAALAGFTLPKLLWVREHEPELWNQVAAWCLPKDFVRFRLTGRLATDVGDAAGTLLFDVDGRRWSEHAHGLFDLASSLSPVVLESCAVAGRISAWAAAATGLREGTPVVAGSGDNQCGAVGAGVVEPGRVLATLGTSGVIYAHSQEPRKDLGENETPAGRVHTMCAADGTGRNRGHWSLTGCMLSAAGSLAWLRESLFPEVPYARLLAEAEGVEPGAGGLVFLPHLTGERCPHPDAEARGAFVGLTSRHTRGHLVRAVVEGVTLTMRQILDIFSDVGVKTTRVRLGGGGAKTPFWRQLQADVYGVPVELPNTEEGPAFGAALMAGVGAGVWADIAEACSATIGVTETREPDAARGAVYDELRGVYGALYPKLRGPCAALGRFDRQA